jgi:hypothetical protein
MARAPAAATLSGVGVGTAGSAGICAPNNEKAGVLGAVVEFQ